jgi:hypothetical protein
MSTRNQPGYAVLAVAVVGLPLQRVTQHLVSLSKSLGIIHRKKKSQLVSTSYIYSTESSCSENLELLGRVRVVGILVRMHLSRLNKETE